MSWDDKFSRGFQVEELKYVTSPAHTLIGVGNSNASVINIGQDGDNLTIAVLSMNRSSLTIRLMDSITEYLGDFKGEFLIGDNGSTDEEKAKLRKKMQEVPYKCRMLEFDKNYGVGGGRNRVNAEVQTDWILQLDNDIYFVGNPLKKIQHDIAQTGCHFLCMPLLNQKGYEAFLYGGHLYIENIQNQISVGGGSAFISTNVVPNEEHAPFLCTFLSGGTSIINKKTFIDCGGYDEGMFIGFEDIEFSLRLFQSGYKIGTCGMACLIHDHPKPEQNADAEYEKKRFSAGKLYESAKYFEKKHGFKVWNPMVEDWVNSRLNDLLDKKDDPAVKELSIQNKRPKIAIVIDCPNWALHNVSKQIVKNLSGCYEFKIIPLSVLDNFADILLVTEDCAMVHFLWRPLASSVKDDYTLNKIYRLGMSYDDFYKKYIKTKVISVAVYDHLLLEGEQSSITRKLFSDPDSVVQFYTVSSNKLKKLYDGDKDIVKKPDFITPDGVDLTIFKPMNLERFDDIDKRTVRIGWVGNSKWQSGDLKGINTIIKPAVQILQRMGYNIELITSDRQDMLIPHEKMPYFYANIDLYICASIYEGTPNPVLESMACGIPVVSTNVGIVPDAFGELQKVYILEERSVSYMVQKIKELLDRPEMFKKLSKENLDCIQPWDWSIMTQNFKDYFDLCLNK